MSWFPVSSGNGIPNSSTDPNDVQIDTTNFIVNASNDINVDAQRIQLTATDGETASLVLDPAYPRVLLSIGGVQLVLDSLNFMINLGAPIVIWADDISSYPAADYPETLMVNSVDSTLQYSNGTAWIALGSGGGMPLTGGVYPSDLFDLTSGSFASGQLQINTTDGRIQWANAAGQFFLLDAAFGFQPPTFATADRPTGVSYRIIYDVDLEAPLYSDGTGAWFHMDGTPA